MSSAQLAFPAHQHGSIHAYFLKLLLKRKERVLVLFSLPIFDTHTYTYEELKIKRHKEQGLSDDLQIE